MMLGMIKSVVEAVKSCSSFDFLHFYYYHHNYPFHVTSSFSTTIFTVAVVLLVLVPTVTSSNNLGVYGPAFLHSSAVALRNQEMKNVVVESKAIDVVL